MKLLLLAIAGGLGTLARYGMSAYIFRYAGTAFPWHTFAVNMAGCFAFGVAFAFLDGRADWDGNVKVIVLGGFMGAFTTYSTFAFETSALIRESHYGLAAGNVAAQGVLGVTLVFLGAAAGKWLGA